jgi:hypothetical protein
MYKKPMTINMVTNKKTNDFETGICDLLDAPRLNDRHIK